MSVVFSWENTGTEVKPLQSFRRLNQISIQEFNWEKSKTLAAVCADKNRLINFSCFFGRETLHQELLLNPFGLSHVFCDIAIEFSKCSRHFCIMKHLDLLFYTCLNVDL